jgi:phospholipase B1
MLKAIILLTLIVCSNCYEIDEYVKIVHKLSKDNRFTQDFSNNIKKLIEIEPNYFDYTPFNKDYSFDCNVTYENDDQYELPRSVHKLRPRDIKVVAALGDSITASLGTTADNVLGLLVENRGRSWSIGGDSALENVVTLPNFLKKYNSDLTGYSTGSNIVFFYNGGRHLNVAVSGNEANHILAQAERLINKMKNDSNINYEKDWKMITLFIGGNDLCRFCFNYEKHSPDAYIKDIEAGLDLLYKEVPRAFVNLVPIFRVEQVKELNIGLVCNVLHIFECKCGAFPTKNETQKIKEFTDQYQNYTINLANSGKYDGRIDFTVVAQPFFTNFVTPKLPDGTPDISYLAPDCFHLSSKGHSNILMNIL